MPHAARDLPGVLPPTLDLTVAQVLTLTLSEAGRDELRALGATEAMLDALAAHDGPVRLDFVAQTVTAIQP